MTDAPHQAAAERALAAAAAALLRALTARPQDYALAPPPTNPAHEESP